MAPGPRGETPPCYVSSEHCYPKPGASWEKSEEKDPQTGAVKEEQHTEQEVKQKAAPLLHIKIIVLFSEQLILTPHCDIITAS